MPPSVQNTEGGAFFTFHHKSRRIECQTPQNYPIKQKNNVTAFSTK